MWKITYFKQKNDCKTRIFLTNIPQKANYYGSLPQSSTVCLGSGLEGEVNVPFRDLLPMVHPNNIVFDGMQHQLYKKIFVKCNITLIITTLAHLYIFAF